MVAVGPAKESRSVAASQFAAFVERDRWRSAENFLLYTAVVKQDPC